MLLGVPKHTDNLAVYGELGVYPLYIDALDRMLKYWHHIETFSENILLLDAYRCMQDLHSRGANTWLRFALTIKNIYSHNNNDTLPPSPPVIKILKVKLKQHYNKFWETSLMDDMKSKSKHGRKLRTYRKFKCSFGRETYLDISMNTNWRIHLSRFRVSAHRLAIEMGRRLGTELDKRLCPKCETHMIEDEWHFLFICPLYRQEREKLRQIILGKSPLFDQLNDDDQLCWLLSNQDDHVILALAEYVYTAMSIRFPKP